MALLAKQVLFSTPLLIYIGEAPAGSALSASVWRIKKIVLDSSSDVTQTWANGNANFDKVWNNYASYTYS